MNPIIILTVKVPVHWTPQELQQWYDEWIIEWFNVDFEAKTENFLDFVGTQMVRVYEMEIKN